MKALCARVARSRLQDAVERIERNLFRQIAQQHRLDAAVEALARLSCLQLIQQPDLNRIVFQTVPKHEFWNSPNAKHTQRLNRVVSREHKIELIIDEGWDESAALAVPGEQSSLLCLDGNGRYRVQIEKDAAFRLSKLSNAANVPQHFTSHVGVHESLQQYRLLRATLAENKQNISPADKSEMEKKTMRKWITIAAPNLFAGEYRKEVEERFDGNGELEGSKVVEFGRSFLICVCSALGVPLKDTELFFHLLPDEFRFHATAVATAPQH